MRTSKKLTLKMCTDWITRYYCLADTKQLTSNRINKHVWQWKRIPGVLKISRIVPVHKVDSLDDPSSHRSIAVIPLMREIVHYVESLQLFNEYQYSFRKKLFHHCGYFKHIEFCSTNYERMSSAIKAISWWNHTLIFVNSTCYIITHHHHDSK